jgi:hypothetical protein
MSSVTIAWTEATPADTDQVSAGAGDIRSILTAVRTGLAAEHVWPSSSGLAGAHALGSARVFVGTSSQVSSADTAGRLMVDSSNSELWYVGSEASYRLGGQHDLSIQTTFLPMSHGSRLVMSVTSLNQNTWPTGPIDFVGFAGTPYVFVSLVTKSVSDLTGRFATIQNLTSGSCTVTVWEQTGVASTDTVNIHLMAIGIQ